MKKILFAAMILASCTKQDSPVQVPNSTPVVTVTSSQRLCIGTTCNSLAINYTVTNVPQVRSIAFEYSGASVPATVAASGQLRLNSVPSAVVGAFVITTVNNAVIRQAAQRFE